MLPVFVAFFALGAQAAQVPLDQNGLGDLKDEPVASFKGYKLVEATPLTEDNVKLLQSIDDQINDGIIDFWSEPRATGTKVEMLVHPDLLELVESAFDRENIPLNITQQDFQEVIDQEKAEMKMKSEEMQEMQNTFKQSGGRYPIDFENYNSLEEIMAYVDSVATNTAEYTDEKVRASVSSLGTTFEGRPIKILRLALKDEFNRPDILLDCGIHAREWVSPAFCLHAIRQLLKDGQYGLLNKFNFNLIPVANPDGYKYSHTTNRMWRKNRETSTVVAKQFGGGWGQQFGGGFGGGFGGQPGFGQGQFGGVPQQGQFGGVPQQGQFGGVPQQQPGGNPWESIFGSGGSSQSIQIQGNPSVQQAAGSKCIGVDPNRNFDIAHGSVGSSNSRCQDTYHGTAPFTSAEARALRTAVQNLGQNLACYVSVHAFSQMWMTPNGYTKQLPQDYQAQMRVGRKAVSALQARYGTSYQLGPIAKIIYEAAGSSVDWAYAKAGVKYCYALELRDTGRHGFMLPANEIRPTVEETWDGITAMANEIHKEY